MKASDERTQEVSRAAVGFGEDALHFHVWYIHFVDGFWNLCFCYIVWDSSDDAGADNYVVVGWHYNYNSIIYFIHILNAIKYVHTNMYKIDYVKKFLNLI